MRAWSDQRVAAAAGADRCARTRRPRGRRPDAGGDRLARGRRPATCSSGCPASASTAARSPRRRSRRARGACSCGRSARPGGRGRARGGAAQPTPPAALGALARAWRRELRAARDRGHRLGRQDLDQGPDRRADRAAPRGRVEPARTSTPRSGCRWRSSARRRDTEVLVLEMGMRGFGQIAELAAIAEPDVGVITNIGPVHLEQMGSLEGVARAKARAAGRAARRRDRGRARPTSRCSSRGCASR